MSERTRPDPNGNPVPVSLPRGTRLVRRDATYLGLPDERRFPIRAYQLPPDPKEKMPS